MLVRKHPRLAEAKTVWSVSTRAAIVRLGREGKLMRRARKANQVVAAGPNTAVVKMVVSEESGTGDKGGGGRTKTGHVPPP